MQPVCECGRGALPALRISERADQSLRFYRIKARRGWGRAIFALAHKILVIAYCLLKTGTPYQELGGDYFDKLNPDRTARRRTVA